MDRYENSRTTEEGERIKCAKTEGLGVQGLSALCVFLLGDSNQEIKYGFCNLFPKHLKYLTSVRHKTKHLYGNTFHSVLILGGF